MGKYIKKLSKKKAIELQKKIDDPNNPYFFDATDYYYNVVPTLHKKERQV